MSEPIREVPMVDLAAEIDTLWADLMAATEKVLRSGSFVLGENVSGLEAEIAAYLGVRHAVAVNSGTDALVIALSALGIGAGDEVITTCMSFFATAEAVSQVGASPIFVDIDPETYNLDPSKIEACISPRTRALIPVHLYGHAAEMDRILEIARKHQLLVLEDAAQAFGARYRGQRLGSLGDAGAFSFYPSKNLGAYGDGGLLATQDDKVAERARMLRNHGSRVRYENEFLGYASRLDEIQAAFLRLKLPQVDDWNQRRRDVAKRYDDLLRDTALVTTPRTADYADHVFHQYTIRIAGGRRDAVAEGLADAGIRSAIYYPIPLHQTPPYSDRGDAHPVSESAAGEVLSLPIWPHLDLATQRRIAETIRRWV